MTREEASEIINNYFFYTVLPRCNGKVVNKRKLEEAINMAIKALKQPEIVKCEDCEFGEWRVCPYSAVFIQPDGFCSRGRRKEE